MWHTVNTLDNDATAVLKIHVAIILYGFLFFVLLQGTYYDTLGKVFLLMSVVLTTIVSISIADHKDQVIRIKELEAFMDVYNKQRQKEIDQQLKEFDDIQRQGI